MGILEANRKMKILVPKESRPGETRIAVVPDTVAKLVKFGASVHVERGSGVALGLQDAAFEKAGATIVADPAETSGDADMVLRLSPPSSEEIQRLKKGAILVSYLDPFRRPGLIKELATAGVSAICMELIPRTTLAQKMDALSSQASLAGYVAVVLAAERLSKVFPMMMTPSGTIKPARVFIIGAGVAGLQAIATARRLGARVEAFDTRPVVKEQVQSLGAKFIEVDLGETGQTKDGYAKALTEEQISRQREAMAKCCADADVVITTAQVFGRKAPVIVTADMVGGMKPGSVIIDLAIETGGNVEGAKLDDEVDVNGVRIVGLGNLPGRVAMDASQMYSNNLANLLTHFWDKETKTMKLDLDDEIMQGCLLTHEGNIRNDTIKALTA
jgi:NAD(P) transhydrogenase subunit alpha